MSFALIAEPLVHLGLTQTCLLREDSAATRHRAISVESAEQYILYMFRVAKSLDTARGPQLLDQSFLSAQFLRRYVFHAFLKDELRMHSFTPLPE